MDILTQGVVGAIVSQCAANRKELRSATIIGFFGGLLADADGLIRSAQDPLYTLEFHRHFTHSLIFIPAGGLIAAALLWIFFRNKLPFKKLYLYATLGYATCGLLDAFTTYGTHLFWPFTDDRVAARIIAIVDPLFTLTLIAAVILAIRSSSNRIARAGVAFAALYLFLGMVQRDRAEDMIPMIAKDRGHTPQRYEAKPTMGNLVLWRSIYEADGIFHVDAIRLGLFSRPVIYPGTSVKKFELERDLPELARDDVLYNDIRRFTYFSDDYVAFHPQYPSVLGDIRYSLLPDDIQPLWGIGYDLHEKDRHVTFNTYRAMKSDTLEKFKAMLLGRAIGDGSPIPGSTRPTPAPYGG